jgi:hypothetical protein
MPPVLSKCQKKVKEYVEGILKKLPKINNKTGKAKLGSKQDGQLQHLADFIYPFRNPTIVRSNEAVNISTLDPEEFALAGSKIILLGPDIFWHGLVQVRCPLCSQVASPHGWCKTLRRVKGLHNTYFLVGRRYKCVGCKGEHKCDRSPRSPGVTGFGGPA